MAESNEQDEVKGRAWRRPSDPFPWARFYWKDWLADVHLRRLTLEQRGRFMDVFASTHGTDTPGVMTEDDVCAWAGYTTADWKKVRDVYARVFDLKRRRGKWVLKAVLEAYEASLRASKAAHEKAMKGVAARRGGKDLATTGTTPGQPAAQPQLPLQVQPGVQPVVDQITDVRGSDTQIQITGKTDSASASGPRGSAQTSRIRAGSAGVAGSSRPSGPLEPIVARALHSRPPANGGSA